MASRALAILMLGAVWYFLALPTQIGWLYLFCALTWSMGAVSILFAWWNLGGIEVSRVVLGSRKARPEVQVPGISEDDELEIGLIVKNRSLFPKHLLRIAEFCPLEEPGKEARSFFLVSLGSRQKATVPYRVRCYRRGEFAFPQVTVEASGPFGVLKLRKEFPAPLSVLAHPACYPLADLPLANHAWDNHGRLFKARAGSLFCGSREYQRGDPLRHVHWRNTARRATLMIKEFEETDRGSHAITFDAASDFGEGKESTLEYAIKIAASAARLCASRRMRAYLVPGQNSRGHMGGHFARTLEFLARLKPGAETNLNELLARPWLPYPVLAIVSMADANQLAAIKELSTKTSHIIVVALAGFAKQELPEAALTKLRTGNMTIIPCHRGKLQPALRALEAVNGQAALASVAGGPR